MERYTVEIHRDRRGRFSTVSVASAEAEQLALWQAELLSPDADGAPGDSGRGKPDHLTPGDSR